MFKIRNSTQKNNIRLLFIAAAEILTLCGCAQMRKEVRVCPGKKSVAESLSSLRVQSENATPLKADGQCLLQYYNGDRKPKKENFPVKLWVNLAPAAGARINPPVEIYMQGDIAFDPKGIVLGSNEDEFWLAVKLKEVSSFWWGQWSERNYPEKLMISPRLVLEALGVSAFADASVSAKATPDRTADKLAVEDEENWSLSNEGAFDVLTKQEDGIKTKKIYINNCDYLVRKIEYFDDDGQVAIAVESDKYKEISKNFFVPGVVKIVNYTGSNKGDSVQITLGSVKPTNFTDKQRKRLFVRPKPQGFKHIYKIVDGNIVELPK
jgi:hypothetical protein